MQFEELIPFLVIAASVIYSLITGSGDKKKKKQAPPLPPPEEALPKKKRKARRHQQQPTEEQAKPVVVFNRGKKSAEQLKREIQAQFDKLEEEKRRKAARPKEGKKPTVAPVFEEELILEGYPEEPENSKYFDYDHKRIERHNLDDSPKTHKEDEHFKSKKTYNKGVKIGRDFKFDIKQAIIYKEVMERKYFKI